MQLPLSAAHRLRPYRCSEQRGGWQRLAVLAVAAGISGGLTATMQAAENLWLNLARATITPHDLQTHVGVLADDMLEGREVGSRGGRAAARYIQKFLQQAGLTPAGHQAGYAQPFGGNAQNLLALLPGTDPALQDEYLLIGAHYDHVGYGNRRNSYGPWGFIHNGADDNASGVAALMELIEACQRSHFQPRRSVVFAFWDGEEQGLLGSKHWIRSPTLPLEDLRLAINIDMVGRLKNGRIEVGGSRTGQRLRRLLSTRHLAPGTWLDFNWEYKDNSDHWTFFQAGIPSIYLHTGVHEDYHRPSDDVEKLNVSGMCEVTRYLLEQLAELAAAEHLPSFRPQARYENPRYQRRQERVLPPLAPRLGFEWEFEPQQQVAQVRKISPRSAAFRAGIRTEDRIVGVNGFPLTERATLAGRAWQSGQELALKIVRAGTELPQPVHVPLVGQPVRLGISWRVDSAEPDMVILTRVVPHAPAACAGLVVHDRIYALDGQPFAGQEDLLRRVEQKMAAGDQELLFEVESRGVVRDVVVPLELPAPEAGDATL